MSQSSFCLFVLGIVFISFHFVLVVFAVSENSLEDKLYFAYHNKLNHMLRLKQGWNRSSTSWRPNAKIYE